MELFHPFLKIEIQFQFVYIWYNIFINQNKLYYNHLNNNQDYTNYHKLFFKLEI